MTQKFQYNAYTECYSYLKPGQCIMVQDFAKNRDIVYQEESKAYYWQKNK